jgi:uncharacterized membrane protein
MKKKIIAIILVMLMYILLVKCTYTSSAQPMSAEMIRSSNISQEDTNKNRNLSNNDTINVVFSYTEETPQEQRVQKAILRKEVKPMEVDTLKKFKRDSVYKKLEETEIKLNMQYEKVDSIMIVRKK